MGLAQEDIARIGGRVKRLFPEAKKIEVHRKIPLDAFYCQI
jgi:hypothetical protein